MTEHPSCAAVPHRRHGNPCACRWCLGAAALALALVAVPAGARADSDADRWTVEVEPVYLTLDGLDRHVMTRRETNEGVERITAVHLDTDDGLAYRARVELAGERRTWGLAFFAARATQSTPALTAAAAGGRVAFEVPERAFVSGGADETLFFRTLEDTVAELWTADLYARQELLENADGALGLELGLRFGDFDNDYRAVVGVEGEGGRRLDASSNYDRLMGPRVALTGEWRLGEHALAGTLGQSVLIGTADKLTSRWREFRGPFDEDPNYVDEASFERRDQEVAIPVSELRVRWTWSLTRHFAVGAGAETAVWWDVPVPPGVVPSADFTTLDERTLVLFGLSAAVAVRF